jgi:hypothetical protein
MKKYLLLFRLNVLDVTDDSYSYKSAEIEVNCDPQMLMYEISDLKRRLRFSDGVLCGWFNKCSYQRIELASLIQILPLD